MRLIPFFIFFFITIFCHAQNDSARISKNILYTEFGELSLSLYYERMIFNENNNRVSIRVGATPIFLKKDVYPIGFGIQYSRGKKNTFSAGASIFCFNGIAHNEPKHGTSYVDTMSAVLFLAPRVNYRYQRENKGLYFHFGIFSTFRIAELYTYNKHGLEMVYFTNLLIPTLGIGYTF